MKTQYKRMVQTRRLYDLENSLYDKRKFSYLTKQRTLKSLREFAEFIWKKEKFSLDIPFIYFGEGIFSGDIQYSFCDGLCIELATGQRNILTVVHELVHALGYDFHDEAFVEMEWYLLNKYTPIDKQLLVETFSTLL